MTAGDMKRLMVAWKNRHRENVKMWKGQLPLLARYPRGHLLLTIAGVWVFWARHIKVEYNPRLQAKEYARCESDGHALHIPGLAFIW